MDQEYLPSHLNGDKRLNSKDNLTGTHMRPEKMADYRSDIRRVAGTVTRKPHCKFSSLKSSFESDLIGNNDNTDYKPDIF